MADDSNAHASPASEGSQTSAPLRTAITTTREFLNRTVTAARTHSPIADDKLEAADDAVAGVIHTGYQAVKRIAVYGHPGVILPVAAVVGAVPSIPFGPRAIVRNAVLLSGLAAVMIYPDHLRKALMPSDQPPSSSS